MYTDDMYFLKHIFYVFQCYAWGWYLANDMQFYLLSPFILILLYK